MSVLSVAGGSSISVVRSGRGFDNCYCFGIRSCSNCFGCFGEGFGCIRFARGSFGFLFSLVFGSGTDLS